MREYLQTRVPGKIESEEQPKDGPELRVRRRSDFQVIGHRGARGLFPENTIEGFTRAGAAGVIRFEIDIAVTRDDVPVVAHDPVLNPDITRGESGFWLAAPGPAIRALMLSELARYDVGRIRPGSRYARRYPEQQPIEPARIPTLAAVLEAASEAWFTIELKTFPDTTELTVPPERMVDLVLEVAGAAGALGRIRLQSFDWRGPRYLGRIRPEIARAWLTEPKTVSQPELWWGMERRGSVAQAVAAEGGDTWAPEHASLTPGDMAEARALGLAVVPWTVNEAGEMARWMDEGAAGVITDRPDVALALVAERRSA
ncbi:MAG: glycerophosphodiester phosphodiesterase family protein [Acetobacteraceae bacterium]